MMNVLCPVLLSMLAPQEPDLGRMVSEAKLTLSQAVEAGIREAKAGAATQAELEFEKNRVVWSIDVAQGDKVHEVLLDAKDGSVVGSDEEAEDCSALLKAAKMSLAEAVAAVVKEHQGVAVMAQLHRVDSKVVVTVGIFADGKKSKFDVDVGDAVGVEKQGKKKAEGEKAKKSAKQGSEEMEEEEEEGKEEKGEKSEKSKKSDKNKKGEKSAKKTAAFTDDFGEVDGDLGPTGRNPYFVLEPGYVQVLEGKDEGEEARITITVLNETKRIAGIEARVVEEKEMVGGKVEEITRDYFAISKRTNNVYYLGEDVDVYKDGAVVSHEGAWLHGQNGAHYGLMMPAVPMLGARFQQETAPGVAMDRAEIESMSATFECPAGKFAHVLVIVESTPLEQKSERKHYAPGAGLLQDGGLRLVQYGFPATIK